MPALILHRYQIAPGYRVFKVKVQEFNRVENFSKYFSIMDFEMSKELYSATKCLKTHRYFLNLQIYFGS